MLSQRYQLQHLEGPIAHEVRAFMREEFLWSSQRNKLYFGQYLSEAGRARYSRLLEKALRSGSPDSLAESLAQPGLWQANAPRKSVETFAWDEFNKYYMRGLCRWVQLHPHHHALEVIRGRASQSRRASSDATLGNSRNPEKFLQALRESPRINPFGANSGLTLRIRRESPALKFG